MRNIKLIIEYDGTKFFGWQYQKNQRTVQHELEAAIERITLEKVTTHAAGRTDAGVHARGQVVNFRLNKAMNTAVLQKGLNAVLPPDVRIRHAEIAEDLFHARFSAKERRYRYYIATRPLAIGRQYYWFYPHPLDWDAMQAACALIAGCHNFQSFCPSKLDKDHYLCDVRKAVWLAEGPVRIFEIHANRFLHHMVRCLVGTFVQLGRGRIPSDEFKNILESQDRRKAGYTAPAHGLVLEEVLY